MLLGNITTHNSVIHIRNKLIFIKDIVQRHIKYVPLCVYYEVKQYEIVELSKVIVQHLLVVKCADNVVVIQGFTIQSADN